MCGELAVIFLKNQLLVWFINGRFMCRFSIQNSCFFQLAVQNLNNIQFTIIEDKKKTAEIHT